MTTNEPPADQPQNPMSSDLPSYGSTPPPPEGSYPPPPPSGPPAPPGGAAGFSASAAFGYGWKKFTENLGPILVATLVLLVASAVVQIVAGAISGDPFGTSSAFEFSLGSTIGQVLSAVVGFIVSALIARGAIDITEGKKFDLGAAYRQLDLGKVILTSLLVGIVISIGLVLCILPGLVAAFFTLFALYFVVDKDIDPVESIKSSFRLVKDNVANTLIMMVLSFLAVLAGALACGIGLLVALPVVQIAWAYAYKTFQGESVAS